jgi:hypothetical protein
MERYIVIAPHTAENCVKALQQVEAIGYITHFDWGCRDGEHCGWVIIEADSAKEALMVVPSSDRASARAIKLTKFTPADIKPLHKA